MNPTFNWPSFNKLLAHLQKHKGEVDTLLFVLWDRFSRNTEQSYSMISKLEAMGIGIQAME
ncbi:MAG: recombinase family protein [bacterium]